MKFVSKDMAEGWAEAYKDFKESGQDLTFPSETLVRLFKGDYITGESLEYKGKSVLDVGFGNGNNTVFLASLGLEVSGVEIHDDICEEVSLGFKKTGFKADLRVGTNQEIPFDDNTFDYLVSWNVLHYEGKEEGVKRGIEEYARVLKKTGRLILSTTGPDHKILEKSETVGSHQYKIGRPGDFRSGQIHFFFDAPNYIELYFKKYFSEIQIGRIEDKLFKEKLDWWLVTGIKK